MRTSFKDIYINAYIYNIVTGLRSNDSLRMLPFIDMVEVFTVTRMTILTVLSRSAPQVCELALPLYVSLTILSIIHNSHCAIAIRSTGQLLAFAKLF